MAKENLRDMYIKMICVHELPLYFIERDLFTEIMECLDPNFLKWSQATVKEDLIRVYQLEKEKLKKDLEYVDRLSLTSHLWTTTQRMVYVCLTGHYVDPSWNFQRVVLNFFEVEPPNTEGVITAKIAECLQEWGFQNKICTLTLDNATSNSAGIRKLKEVVENGGSKLLLGGSFFHVPCGAMLLNLLVKDGLTVIENFISKARDFFKYLRISTARQLKFKKIAKLMNVNISNGLCLDVSTKWNSTFIMLEHALVLRTVFKKYQDEDPFFIWLPSDEEWDRCGSICKFLEIFYDIACIFSNPAHPTSNLFLLELCRLKEFIYENCTNEQDYIREISFKMKRKFDKYWRETSILLSIAAVLDPRNKMALVKYCFPKIYDIREVETEVKTVNDTLHDLYNWYASSTPQKSMDTKSSSPLKGIMHS